MINYKHILGASLVFSSGPVLAQLPAVPAAPALPPVEVPTLPEAPSAPDASQVMALAEDGQAMLMSGQAMLMDAIPSDGGMSLPGLEDAPAAPSPDAAMAALADGEAMLMDALAGSGDAPDLPAAPADAQALMDALAEGEAMLMDQLPDAGLPESGTVDINSDNGINTDMASLSNSYQASLPEEGGGEVSGTLMDETATLAYGGTLEELSYSYNVAGETGSGTLNLAEPQNNEPSELPGAPELPTP